MLAKGGVHVAGIHLRDPKTGEYNLKSVHDATGRRPSMVVNFARWELGLAVAARNPLNIRGFADLVRPQFRIVNRELGSGARLALDEALKELGCEISGSKATRESCPAIWKSPRRSLQHKPTQALR
jgi:molybdate-binding protein